ncbi:HlyD family efflux transporter periplasmic adaptor subunit [Christiangramia sp.]|uniref:HlyD family secretion protein n=1 Tax=Christiangramia sp. TaxID=1931228 RepID=UPI00261E7177|nr:HlyD family efflux transporter periplasmic adaptor subunit [Christiangramia sp.]
MHIKAKSGGKIFAINYQPGDLVSKGDILGELENDSNTKDVVNLRANLDTVFKIQTLKDLNEIYPPHLILGNDLQLYYNAFLSNYHHLILEASLNDQSIHDHQMRQELSNQLYSIDSKNEELSIAKRNLEVSETNYKRFQELFNKGVVSQVDLENIEKDFLMQQRQFHFLNQQYNQLILENKGILSRLQLLSNTSLKTKRNLEVDLLLSQQNLISAIQKWEDTYLLKSPIDGRLSYFEVWGEYQNVENGESVYSVVPDIQQNLIGKCIIPIRNAGKLKKGQKVNLKLDNYPYHEWGMVRAKVGSISQIPKGGDNPGYIVYLTINDLKTSYGKELEFHQELNGTAEILLKEVTLIERIFYQFRHLWSSREF